MAQTTVAQFAAELGLPVALLLDQLKSAGVVKSAVGDNLEEADKSALLDYLRKEHGAEQAPKNKITLTRKSNTEIRKTDSSGRARTIQVEVRKKRVLVRNEEQENTSEAAPETVIAEVIEPEVLLPEVVLPEIEVVVEAPVEIIEAAEILMKYEGYIEREQIIADKISRLENIRIKGKFDYNELKSLSIEARQKLTKIDPDTIAQASRIPGISPSDINILLVLLGNSFINLF